MLAVFELVHGAADAFEDVQGLEAGDDDGDFEALGQLRVLLDAHHAAHVSGGQEGLDPAVRGSHDRLDGGGHADVRDEEAEVGDAEPAGLVDRHGVGGGGGLEADAEEHDLAAGVAAGDLQRVQR
ncbi:hypothetical protein GCM10020000_01060 [Streptomyces olivoverticillatus]